MKKILIIKLRHIGDVLLTIPTIRAVRETFPEAYIAALVNKGTEEMLTENPLLDDVIVYDRGMKRLSFSKRFKGEIKFIRDIRSKGIDMTIDLTSGDRGAIYSYLSGARYRAAYDPEGKGFWGKRYMYTHSGKRLKGRNHTVLHNLHLVRQFGIDTKDLSVNIFFSEEDKQYIDKILSNAGVIPSDKIIQIHPTSRWLFKCWKDNSMAKVIDLCEDSMGIRVVITSAPDKRELSRINNIMRHIRSSPINMAGMLSLKQLAALSSRVSLFLGVDTAPMHIAAAVDTPVVALFGPSGAFDWGPWDNSKMPDARCQMPDKTPHPRRNGMQSFGVHTELIKGTVPDLRTSLCYVAESGPSPLSTPYPRRNGVQAFGIHTVIQRDWECVPCGKDGCNGSKQSKCLEDIRVEEVIEIIDASLSYPDPL